jgi:release factor glutamine methyltransferase
MLTLLEVLDRTANYFTTKGVPGARHQAEWILANAMGCKRLDLFVRFDTPMPDAMLEKLRPMVKRRAQREPLQYVIGSAPFHNLTLRCDARALIPRPETEELVEALINRFKETPPARVLDLGTGTGAIALALAKAWSAAQVTAVDASDEAIALARENAAANGLEGRVQFAKSDWFADVTGAFDLIASNPPYLTRAEWEGAEPEVRDHEPYGALVAGNDGLADLERILRAAPEHLSAGGTVALETGIAHHAALKRLAQELGYARQECAKDLSARPRFFFAAQ